MDDRSPLPVLELQRPEAMAHPLVNAGEDPWRFGDPEVGLPSGQVRAQILTHGRKTLADAASGQSADALLQALQGFGSHAPLDLPSRSDPEREAEELAFCGARHHDRD